MTEHVQLLLPMKDLKSQDPWFKQKLPPDLMDAIAALLLHVLRREDDEEVDDDS